ncbi:MAG: response regulator [Proteobacteria bacterium]|nr:response regulator [Pseudomonadota bacterium]MBU1709503.1 response regulator [Pseudomonadota bacterium]
MATILLVDDDKLVLAVTQELLEFLKHKVFAANNGQTALDILKKYSQIIDIVLLDLSLPDMNGADMIPIIMNQAPKCKIVVCTGGDFKEDDTDTFSQRGIAAILLKPFEFDELKSTLNRLLA